MGNKYCALGPALDDYKEMVKAHPPEVAIAHLRGGDVITLLDSHQEMKNFYVQNKLFEATGCVYKFFILDEEGKPEEEVYPNAGWLTLMQKPRMTVLALQEADMAFRRLTAPPPSDPEQEDPTDNYVQMSALWRGLEYRIIAQVMKPKNLGGLSEDTVIYRPEYLRIDPFLLMRLAPMPGVQRSGAAMVKEKKQPLPDNVASMFDRKPKG